MRMGLNEVLNLVEDRIYHLDGTKEPEKRYEMLITIIRLFKVALDFGTPRLPVEVELGGRKKRIKTKQDLFQFLSNLETWLLKARDELDDEDLAPLMTRAKIIVLQLVYKDLFDSGEVGKLGVRAHINEIKENRPSLREKE